MRVQALDKANRRSEGEATTRAGTLTFPVTLVLLALGGTLTRLPFVCGTPVNWDAVQFELASDASTFTRTNLTHPVTSYTCWGAE